MVGFNEDDSRFYLSEECYIDFVSQVVVDKQEGKTLNKTDPITAGHWRMLLLLIQNSPRPVDQEEISSSIHIAHDSVRKYFSTLKSKHSVLGQWLPACVDGKYKFINPSTPTTITEAPIQRSSCALQSRNMPTCRNFVEGSRDDIFDDIDEAFSGADVVFLWGIGGIGKSEVAKSWAHKKKQEGVFDTVVFAQLNSEESNSNVLSLITDDTTFVITGSFRNRGDISTTGIEESTEDYFERKLAEIMRVSNKRTLIIIDNYDMEDPYLERLFGGNYRLLITTRNKYEGMDYPFVHIEEIKNDDHLKSLFFVNLGNERDNIKRDDPYIEKLFDLVSRHTLAIEIIAKALADSVDDTPETIYVKMTKTGLGVIDGEVKSYVSREKMSPAECIRILFNLSRIRSDKDYEYKAQVLAFMSAMPTRGIERWLFKKWSTNDTYRATKALIKRSWLREDTIDGVEVISMHPLIREIVWSDLEPSIGKCSMFIDKFKKDDIIYIDGLYHQPKETKERYAMAALSMLSSFPVHDLDDFDFYCKIQRMLHVCAKAEPALQLAKKLEHLLESIGETETWRYSFIKYRIGAAYMTLYRNHKDGIAYLSEAAELMSKTARTSEEKMWLAFLYRELATSYCRTLFDQSLTSEPDNITTYLDKGQFIAEELKRNGFTNSNLELYRGTLCVWRSKLEVFRGNFQAAKSYLTEAESEFNRLGYTNTLDKSAILDTRAQIHSIEGDYNAEVMCLIDAANVFIGGFGEHHVGSIERAVKLALAYAKNGQLKQAKNLMLHNKELAIKVCGEDAPLTITVCDTLKGLQEAK